MMPSEPMQDTIAPDPQKLTGNQLDVRYDAHAKVTGKAIYSYEHKAPDHLYAYVVQSTIPSGSVASIDQAAAEHASGVVAVLTPFNAPKLPVPAPNPPASRHVTVLQDASIAYNGQPIALIVARTQSEAKFAASLLKITYRPTPAKLDFKGRLSEGRAPRRGQAVTTRGDLAAAMAKATVTIDQTYSTPVQVHNPMEPHATIAWWEGDKLNLFDSTQGITGVRQTAARTFGIPQESVHVECPYTGGGFGGKGSVWSHVILAAMAAKVVGKPVKLAMGREQMFGTVGSRPATVQHIRLGATPDGKLTAIEHQTTVDTSMLEDFLESSGNQTRMLYDSEANVVGYKMVDMNVGVHTFQRGPGESTGTAALETAMDELASKLNMDPVQLRIVNHADKDPSNGHPWTSKHLLECYAQAGDRIGWSKRNPAPRMTREGNKLIGLGMATATYPAGRGAAGAIVRIFPSGRAWVGCGSQDLGTGTYTILAQTCADTLGIDPKLVDAELGNTNLPKAPNSGGSQSAASICPAVADAATQAMLKLFQLASDDAHSPFHGMTPADLDLKSGNIVSKKLPNASESFTALLARNGNQTIEATGSADADPQIRMNYSSHSWGAVFAEVAVDLDTHMVQVRRVVATYDIGTLINKTTGINQMHGGVVWGIGFALHEEAILDPVYGRTVNENLAEYHVPVNLDIGEIDITVVGIPDTKFNPLGARGIGEIGITGVSAAIGNAIFHATGKRVRDFPITLDKLMSA